MSLFKELDLVEMNRLYGEGLGMKEIGRRLGCSYNTVRNRLIYVGVSLRRRGCSENRRLISLPVEEILEARGRGETYKSLGERYGVDEKTIRNRVRNFLR